MKIFIKFLIKILWFEKKVVILQRKTGEQESSRLAKIAQLVEHDLAKVGVAGSSPVFRSQLIY